MKRSGTKQTLNPEWDGLRQHPDYGAVHEIRSI
jgi:hypothetical protein